MLYSFTYSAEFLSSKFDAELLSRAIPKAEEEFNNLPREKGHRRKITVSINSQKKCLDITLDCDVDLDPDNYLIAAQYFSKVLSSQPGMEDYIVDGNLLRKIG